MRPTDEPERGEPPATTTIPPNAQKHCKQKVSGRCYRRDCGGHKEGIMLDHANFVVTLRNYANLLACSTRSYYYCGNFR